MNNFNGQGKPLDDKRLTLSGTTKAGEQQYRIWRDSQQILVPKGQSITKPYATENVQANTGVFGDIRKGYFQSPTVEFRNTQDYNLFDRFRLSSYRDEFPTDPDIDLETMGIYLLDMELTLVINFNGYQWEIQKDISLLRKSPNVYQTYDAYHITTYTPYNNQGIREYSIEFFSYFNIGLSETHILGDIGFGGHTLYMGLQNCIINRGASQYLYTPIFNPNISEITFTAKDIKIERGWQ